MNTKYILKFNYDPDYIDSNLLPWKDILYKNTSSSCSKRELVEEYQIGICIKSKSNGVEFITPFFIHIPYSECSVLIDGSDIELKLSLHKYCYFTRIAIYKFDTIKLSPSENILAKQIMSNHLTNLSLKHCRLNNMDGNYYINAVDDTNILLTDTKVNFKNMMNENIYPHIWLESYIDVDLDKQTLTDTLDELYEKIVPGSPVYRLNTDALDSDIIIGIVHSNENNFINIIPMVSVYKLQSQNIYSNIFVDYEINSDYFELTKKDKQRSNSTLRRPRTNTFGDSLSDSLDKLTLEKNSDYTSDSDRSSSVQIEPIKPRSAEKISKSISSISSNISQDDFALSGIALNESVLSSDELTSSESASSILGRQEPASSVLGWQGPASSGPIIIKQSYSKSTKEHNSLQIGDQIVSINNIRLDKNGYMMLSETKTLVPMHTYLWYNSNTKHVFEIIRDRKISYLHITSENILDKITFDIETYTNYKIIDSVIFCNPNLLMVEWLQNKELIFKNNLYLQYVLNPYYKSKFYNLMVGIINKDNQPNQIKETIKPYEANIYEQKKYVEFFTVLNINSSNSSNIISYDYLNKIIVSDSRENELTFSWLSI